MQLACIPIADKDVFKLAGLLRTGGFEDVANKLTDALLIETRILALTVTDRESILWALESRRPMRSPSSGVYWCKSTNGGCASD